MGHVGRALGCEVLPLATLQRCVVRIDGALCYIAVQPQTVLLMVDWFDPYL